MYRGDETAKQLAAARPRTRSQRAARLVLLGMVGLPAFAVVGVAAWEIVTALT